MIFAGGGVARSDAEDALVRPAEAVIAARRLIAYYDIRLREPQYPVLEAMQNGIPDDAFIVWDVTQFGYYARTHYQVNHPLSLDGLTRVGKSPLSLDGRGLEPALSLSKG